MLFDTKYMNELNSTSSLSRYFRNTVVSACGPGGLLIRILGPVFFSPIYFSLLVLYLPVLHGSDLHVGSPFPALR